MNCDQVAAMVAADVDGELDGLRMHALQKHLALCPACAGKHQALRDLRRQLGAALPYFAAPPALRVRLQAQHGTEPARRAPPGRWGWFCGGAAAGALLVAGAWILGPALPGRRDTAADVVALHTRATLGDRLVAVASSDQHRVKPWLSARLDYAIPVQDFAAAGFTLAGARIDRLDGRDVATLVYRWREHVIDVFVRPAPMPELPVPARTVRGFHVAAAYGAQMEWLAASDINVDVLQPFVQGLARGFMAPS